MIVELGNAECADWDRYVQNSPRGLPQHLSGWRDVMSETYGYETRYLMALEQGRVVGVMPLFLVRSHLVGSSATTLPGGLCADKSEVASALVSHALTLAARARVKQLVLQDSMQAWAGDFDTACDHVRWLVDIHRGADANWKQLDGETRRQVRLASKNGLSVVIDRTGERLGDFHHVLSRFTHQAGTPVFGIDFLERVIEHFPQGFSIAVVRNDKEPIGAYFQLMLRDTVFGVWGATLPDYLKQGAVYLAYWEILRDAAENGFHFWDMGRSQEGSGASTFKKKWGGTSLPIYQQVAGITQQRVARSMISRVRSDSAFRHFMQIWPRLPFPVVQFLGPRLRRHVPFA